MFEENRALLAGPQKKSGRSDTASPGPNFQRGSTTRVGDVLEVAPVLMK